MSERKIVFLCQFGGAKSVMAASLFNQQARKASLPLIATAASTDVPYDAVPEPVAQLLAGDGIDVRTFTPRGVTRDDLRDAAKVIAIDCDVSGVETGGAEIERWNDVPKPSEDLEGADRAIRRHVNELVESMKREP
jgi:protein-tyrosine-phosphatase